MPYDSVDQLQKVLADEVFHYAKDARKAAGRALGTLVEVITFHLLKAWHLDGSIAIERPLPEYANEQITHNVEFSLHPSSHVAQVDLPSAKLPITSSKIAKALSSTNATLDLGHLKTNQLLSSKHVLRNACTIAEWEASFGVATLASLSEESAVVRVRRLFGLPFAIVECKRVGVEESAGRGPQTIEKAKQGAYVARSVSALQKVRLPDGKVAGVLCTPDGELVSKPYDEFLKEIVTSADSAFLRRFILTVGVVSNHGNWFTYDDHNKELRVLAQSYDWLLFLTDLGLAEFISDLVLSPTPDRSPVREAFLASYTGKGGANQFTKVKMNWAATQVLDGYYASNLDRIGLWFNVIAPKTGELGMLRDELKVLAGKDWEKVHA